jgi:hypothetical protein
MNRLCKGISILLLLMAAFGPLTVVAKERPTIWDLPLGALASELTFADFKGFACGSNGGPPLQKLSGWSDFAQCAPEADGLFEIYFEYDDEAFYRALAHDDMVGARGGGTVENGFPVIASGLFDSAGMLRAIRLISDPRPEQRADALATGIRPRAEHYLLGDYLAKKFGILPERDCKALAPAAGETPVVGQFIKRDCQKSDSATGRLYTIRQRYLRKAGQFDQDPQSRLLTSGQFESSTFAEVRL